MEESTSSHSFGDPCNLYGQVYSHFLEKLDSVSPSSSSTTPSHTSSQKPDRSMLVTGFGMRNLESLQRALLDDEQRRQMLLALHAKDEELECSSVGSEMSSQLTKLSTRSSETTSDVDAIQKYFSLKYLMGITDDGEEEYAEVKKTKELGLPSIAGESEDEASKMMTSGMRQARKYLKEHRIFELFQFIIAHMLSELPDNPIQFIIDLLDKCLVYRSGYGNPPLLYEKPHLEQLFYLMDRMRTGFIDVEQYETGMRTLGICNYDKNPPLSTDGMVAQETFVEEAYDSLTDLFVDMIRRHGDHLTPPSIATPPPTEVKLVPSFITDDGGQ